MAVSTILVGQEQGLDRWNIKIKAVLPQGTWCPESPAEPKRFPLAESHHAYAVQEKFKNISQREIALKEKEKKLYQSEAVLRKSYGSVFLKLWNSNVTIYVITPTYARLVQKAELTRISQTFLHVVNLHWIVVEDSANKTKLVKDFLKNCGLKYTHLNAATPPEYKLAEKDPNWLKPRGVLQRNAAIEWLHTLPQSTDGVVYFGDDDNTYDLRIFEEMRNTKKVSVWPVALVGGLRYEGPICTSTRVTGWFTYWRPERPFPLDMAGFAINLKLFFQKPRTKFALRVMRGYQESVLLQQLVTEDQLEPLADSCTKILVWHTRTEAASVKNEARFHALGHPGSNPNVEV